MCLIYSESNILVLFGRWHKDCCIGGEEWLEGTAYVSLISSLMSWKCDYSSSKPPIWHLNTKHWGIFEWSFKRIKLHSCDSSTSQTRSLLVNCWQGCPGGFSNLPTWKDMEKAFVNQMKMHPWGVSGCFTWTPDNLKGFSVTALC